MNKQLVIDKLMSLNWQGSDVIGSRIRIAGEVQEITESLLKEWAVDLLEEWGKEHLLPEDAVVFCMHQGYSFFYFRESECSKGNPMIYNFTEGLDSNVKEVLTLELFIKHKQS